jgi:hypothetical protein
MSAILPSIKLDNHKTLAKYFMPHQLAWILAEDKFHARKQQVFALAEKSVRIGTSSPITSPSANITPAPNGFSAKAATLVTQPAIATSPGPVPSPPTSTSTNATKSELPSCPTMTGLPSATILISRCALDDLVNHALNFPNTLFLVALPKCAAPEREFLPVATGPTH